MAEKILVIEDNPALQKILSAQLKAENFEVVVAGDGQTGLEAALAPDHPSLILLDVALPGRLNGFQVCEVLQQEANTAHIPVIFLTAHSALDDKLTGFAAGGVDYLVKPFTFPELMARIKATLRRRTVEEQRAQATLNDYKKNLSQNMAHELRTPLSKLQISLGLLAQELPQASLTSLQEIIEYAQIGAEELEDIIEDLLLINKLENSEVQISRPPIGLDSTIENVWYQLQKKYSDKRLTIQRNIPGNLFFYINRDHILKILRTLIDNACKFSSEQSQISLMALPLADSGGELYIQNRGLSIPPDSQERIFEKFFQADMSTTRPRDGLGIGLYIARLIAQTYNGDVTLIHSSPDEGTTFRFYLPQ